MKTPRVTRREFVQETAMAAAGLAAGVAGLNARAAAEPPADTSKILNYNPNMEYRRLGKTGFMVSAVGLGGHSRSKDDERAEVVSRCLEAGINFIDSTGRGELLRDIKALGTRRDQVYLALSETGQEPRN